MNSAGQGSLIFSEYLSTSSPLNQPNRLQPAATQPSVQVTALPSLELIEHKAVSYLTVATRSRTSPNDKGRSEAIHVYTKDTGPVNEKGQPVTAHVPTPNITIYFPEDAAATFGILSPGLHSSIVIKAEAASSESTAPIPKAKTARVRP